MISKQFKEMLQKALTQAEFVHSAKIAFESAKSIYDARIKEEEDTQRELCAHFEKEFPKKLQVALELEEGIILLTKLSMKQVTLTKLKLEK